MNAWTARRRLWIGFAYGALSLVAAAMMLPFLWMLSSSLKTIPEMMAIPIRWWVWPPEFSNYLQAVATIPFGRQLANTLFLSAASATGTLLSSSFAAYGFAKIDWPGRRFFFAALLSTLFLPGFVTFIPTYLIFRNLGWLDTYLPLIVPTFLGSPFYIFLFRQFFLTIPETVSEAARIDGASEWRIFWQIILPLSQPALAAVAILSFVGAWTDYLGPLIYLNLPPEWTLSLGLSEFLTTHSAEWNLLMAAAVIFTLPMVILFFFGGRYFFRGIALSSGDVG